jgi:hypothetical protein
MQVRALQISVFFYVNTCLLFLVYSCQGVKDKTNLDHDQIAEEAIEDFENYRLKLNLEDSNVLEFPSPVELASNYKNSGMKYIPGITNPYQNVLRYETHTKKALNFGVYSADLSYCVVNDVGQGASEYMISLQSLSDDIGLSEILKYEVIITDFNKNLGNSDSLTKIVESIQSDLDANLRKNGIQERAILFYTGAWIESAYLAFNSQPTHTNTVDSATLVQISKQLDMLSSINQELEIMENKTVEMEELEKSLNEFEELTATIELTQKEDSLIINPRDLVKIRDKVEEIREQIVN